ncbi:MAG TPA: ABC transporter ATP-binding protein [Dehalococcoidia bacterium]|jgi:ATP-binding cassette subfamily B protein
MRNLIRLVSYLRFHRRGLAAAFLALAGSVLFTSLTPWVLKEAIDSGIGGGHREALLISAIAIIAFSLGKGSFAYLLSYFGESLSQHVAFDLRRDFYERVQALSFAFHDQVETGQLMSRATVDVEASRTFLGQSLLRFCYTLILVFTVAGIMLALDWRLGCLTLLTIPATMAVSYVVSKRTRPLWLQVQQQIGVETSVLQESIAGIRVVKAFAQEDQQFERFRGANWAVRERSLVANRIAAFNQPFLLFILNTVTVLIVLYGGREAIGGRITIGTLVAFIEYRSQLAVPIRQVGVLVNQASRASSAAERVFQVIDTLSEVREAPDAKPLENVRGHVRFEHASFAYSSGHHVLEEINIDAAPGQMVALLGHTASGKSTLINLIPRFYDVTGGAITIDGVDIRAATLESLRRTVGVVLQEPFLFSASIRANITYGKPDASDEEVHAAARAAQLHDFVMSLPDGYETWVGERGVTLSGGQKQRVAIARMLLIDPRVLVLDDSTSAVDMETEYLIQRALANLMEGRTSFVIAHRLRTAQRADQVIVLENGRIVQQGTHAQLIQEPGFYRETYELQLADEAAALGTADGARRVTEEPDEPGESGEKVVSR